MTNPYRVLATREIYKNPWIRLREDQVMQPGGETASFGVVEMKAGSSVLAINHDREVYLVNEYKYSIQRHSLEVVSGGLEESENPLQTARRELEEEAGLIASEWIDLGVLDPFTTVVKCRNYMFLALGAAEDGEQRLDPGEILQVVKMPFEQALHMVMHSEITHGATCVLILKAQTYLNRR